MKPQLDVYLTIVRGSKYLVHLRHWNLQCHVQWTIVTARDLNLSAIEIKTINNQTISNAAPRWSQWWRTNKSYLKLLLPFTIHIPPIKAGMPTTRPWPQVIYNTRKCYPGFPLSERHAKPCGVNECHHLKVQHWHENRRIANNRKHLFMNGKENISHTNK